MNRKTAALSVGIMTALILSGCSSSTASGKSWPAQQNTPRQYGRNGQLASDPQLQQAMQTQRQDQQQIDQLIRQIRADAGLPAATNPAPPQSGPPNGTRPGGSGQGQPGQAPQGQALQNPPSQQDIQAAKDLLAQEHQAATDLIARLTAFDTAVKQAAGNQKALKDAQGQFTAIEATLPARGRGFASSTPLSLTQGILTRIDAYQAAAAKLDAATAQVKTDLEQ